MEPGTTRRHLLKPTFDSGFGNHHGLYLEDGFPGLVNVISNLHLQAMKKNHLEGEQPQLWDLRSPWFLTGMILQGVDIIEATTNTPLVPGHSFPRTCAAVGRSDTSLVNLGFPAKGGNGGLSYSPIHRMVW